MARRVSKPDPEEGVPVAEHCVFTGEADISAASDVM
jgi:hypothetical protein